MSALDSALAGFVFDVVPAECVVLAGGEDGPAAVRSAWTTRGATADPVSIDPALFERVAKDRVALMIDVDGRHAIVAPMMAFGRAVGSIWAETPSGGRFDEGQVRLLLTVGAIAAAAREQTRETARLQETNELLKAEINLEHNMVGRSPQR